MVTEAEMFESSDLILLHFLFAGLDEKRSLQKESRYARRIAGIHFGCCCPHK